MKMQLGADTQAQSDIMRTGTPNHLLVRTLRRYAARAPHLSRYNGAIHPKGRPGLTIVEVLVVISILGLLMAILLPAVSSIRESARRIQCADNCRQIALAVASFHNANGQLPSLYNGEFFKGPIPRPMHFHAHSWKTSVLPFLEQQPLYESIDFKTRATDPTNAHAANTRIQAFVCPSTPDSDGLVRYINDPSTPTPIGTAARSDYVATAAVRWQKQIDSDFDPRLWHPGAWGEPRSDDTATVVTYGTRKVSFSAIRDGLSNTTLVAESAGRPDRYENGKLIERYNPNVPMMDNHMATWAISTDFVWMALYHFDTIGINSTNQSAIYGFHNGGANVASCDGSVRFLTESTEVLTIQALITRDRSDSTF